MRSKTPKGKLLIIGGAEDKGDEEGTPEIKSKNRNFKPYDILGELLPPVHRKKHSIEVITTASQIPAEMGKTYIKTFERAGFPNVGHMHISNKDEARDPAFLRRIENAHAVLFSGGDQFRLSTILGGTAVIDAITNKYQNDKDFIVAGTSAGAMAMARVMIYQGDNNEALLKGDIKMTSGFGLIDDCIIDTHFVKRGRFGRLAQAVIMNPLCTGIGLGEDTALIITKGNRAECRGSGMVIIIDGKRIGHTNLAYIEENTAVCVEGLKVHILAKGNGFVLNERRFIPADKDIQLEKKME